MSRIIDADSLKDRVLEDACYSDETINHFLSVIDAEPAAWISVQESLPEHYKKVVVTDGGFNPITAVAYRRATDGEFYVSWDESKFNGVIAWMPLPEPYKEGKDE